MLAKRNLNIHSGCIAHAKGLFMPATSSGHVIKLVAKRLVANDH